MKIDCDIRKEHDWVSVVALFGFLLCVFGPLIVKNPSEISDGSTKNSQYNGFNFGRTNIYNENKCGKKNTGHYNAQSHGIIRTNFLNDYNGHGDYKSRQETP